MHDIIIIIIIICTHKTYVYTSSSWLHTHQLVIIHRNIHQMQVLVVVTSNRLQSTLSKFCGRDYSKKTKLTGSQK